MYPHIGLEENNVHEFISECCFAPLSVEPLTQLVCTKCRQISKTPYKLKQNPHDLIIIDKDLLTVTKGIITHQCNCRGAMGAGLALKIRKKYPSVYNKYKEACSKNQFKLGLIQVIKVNDELYVCNLAGQDRYGRSGLFTDYDAVRTALKKLREYAEKFELNVFIPYNMGCTLAGGDFNIVGNIIKEEIAYAIICNYA